VSDGIIHVAGSTCLGVSRQLTASASSSVPSNTVHIFVQVAIKIVLLRRHELRSMCSSPGQVCTSASSASEILSLGCTQVHVWRLSLYSRYASAAHLTTLLKSSFVIGHVAEDG
jgi:hypothetical protein